MGYDSTNEVMHLSAVLFFRRTELEKSRCGAGGPGRYKKVPCGSLLNQGAQWWEGIGALYNSFTGEQQNCTLDKEIDKQIVHDATSHVHLNHI